MANINAPDLEYFESFANEISGKFGRVKKLVGHPTANGEILTEHMFLQNPTLIALFN